MKVAKIFYGITGSLKLINYSAFRSLQQLDIRCPSLSDLNPLSSLVKLEHLAVVAAFTKFKFIKPMVFLKTLSLNSTVMVNYCEDRFCLLNKRNL